MRRLARASARRPWIVLAVYALVCLLASIGVLRLRHEDDVLVFLPERDPDVELFRDVGDRFGSMRVALVGVAVAGEGDVLEPEVLRALTAATTALSREPLVERVTSLTNVTDVAVADAVTVVEPLVDRVPQDQAQHTALAQRVLSREQVVGALVSADLRATTLMVYLVPGASTEAAVERIRDVATAELGRWELHFAGAPFFAEAIYGGARRDVTRLSPVAGVLLVVVVLLSFREIVGVALTFATVAIAELAVLGTMGWIGERYTVLTSTLPVLLLATGSAYAVHVLGRYYLEREQHGPIDAIDVAIDVVLRPVTIAAWTTCAAFLSFLVMDVAPMRAFGLEVALGTAACWLTALTLLPAVLALVPRKPQREQLLPLGGLLLAAWRATEKHRVAVLVVTGVLAVGVALPMRRIEVRTEAQAFLDEGTDAWRAQQFFEERFGGARFVQILVEGDFGDAVAQRRLAMIAERAGAEPGVTQVTSVTDPIAMMVDMLGGGRRLPATPGQVAKTWLLLDGTPDLGPLVRDDHDAALLQVRVRGEALPVLDGLEAWLASGGAELDPLASATVVARLEWLARAEGGAPDHDALVAALAQAGPVSQDDPQWPAARDAAAIAWLHGEDAEDVAPAQREAIERAIVAGQAPGEALAVQLAGDRDQAEFSGELLARALAAAQLDLARARATTALAAAMGVDAGAPRLRHRLAALVADVLDPHVEGSGSVRVRITGEPTLDRALSRSVARNQVRTMILGLFAVLALLVLLFGSVALALTCVVPAALTALALGGVMGLFGVQIDLSTAMSGAILTDTASDFGMHYLWYLRQQPRDEVVRTVGPIMIVSNLLVALGFFAFAMGSSSVMHVFGSLSGATCVLSSIATCVIVPAVWRWVAPRPRPPTG
ncbi:MAG: MMPL family transporter [Nannocystaceae bacterium]|nr:MMPL family transporter [Nannocystaceae bacterium]